MKRVDNRGSSSPVFGPDSVISRSSYLVLLLILVAVQIAQHIKAGMTLPTPWPDESHFLWQSVSFAKNWSLFSDELNQTRTIFWMPPGFLILVGLWFKLTGISLTAARSLSLIANLGSFALLAAAVRRFKLPIINLLIIGLVFTAPGVVAGANVARPETITLLIICLSLFFLIRERLWLSLACVLLSPLFHLNGILFIIGWFGTVGLVRNFKGFGRISKRDAVVLSIVVLAWLAYIVYALSNWDGFIHDMSYQYHRKANRGIAEVLMRTENFLLLLLVLPSVFALLKNKSHAATFVLLVVPALLIVRMGSEMWYDIYYGVAYLGIAVMLVQAISFRIGDNRSERVKGWLILAVALFALYCWGRYDGQLNFKYIPTEYMSWHAMLPADTIPYLTDGEIATIESVLDSINAEDSIAWVQFIPRADAFLLPHFPEKTYRVSHPLFFDRTASVYLFHTSRHIPSWWRFYVESDLKRIGFDSLAQATKLFSRDSTEAWYMIRLQPDSATTDGS